MRTLIRKFIASLLTLSILLTALCMPLSVAENAAWVQATGDVNIRSTPGIDGDILGVLPQHEMIEYLGEISVDSRGIAWYKVACNGMEAWISAKYSVLAAPAEEAVDETASDTSPLSDYHAFYDGYIFELTGSCQARMDEKPDNGLNDAGDTVNWQFAIYQVKPADEPGQFLSCAAPKLAACSWEDNVPAYESGQLDFVWDAIRAGETLQQTSLFYHWPDEYEIRTYETTVFIPDNPEIAGPQQLVYLTDSEALIFDVRLIYNGGYSGYGLGWNISDVQFTRCSPEEYESSRL